MRYYLSISSWQSICLFRSFQSLFLIALPRFRQHSTLMFIFGHFQSKKIIIIKQVFLSMKLIQKINFGVLLNPALFAILLHFCMLWTRVSNTCFVVCHLRQDFRATLMILTNEIKDLRFWILSRPDLGRNVSQLTKIMRDHGSGVRRRILITEAHFRNYDQDLSRLRSLEIVITTSNSRVYEHSLWKWSSVEMFGTSQNIWPYSFKVRLCWNLDNDDIFWSI